MAPGSWRVKHLRPLNPVALFQTCFPSWLFHANVKQCLSQTAPVKHLWSPTYGRGISQNSHIMVFDLSAIWLWCIFTDVHEFKGRSFQRKVYICSALVFNHQQCFSRILCIIRSPFFPPVNLTFAHPPHSFRCSSMSIKNKTLPLATRCKVLRFQPPLW